MNATKNRLLLLSLFILVLDLVTKAWVSRAMLPYATKVVVPGFVNLTYVQNRGVAFGLLSSLGDMGPPILIVAGGLALVVVVVYFRQTASEQLVLLWSLALILGGAVGNLIDRIAHGSVTDFIDVYVGAYHWHTFNVADSAISVGICLMLFDLLRQRRRTRRAVV